MGIQVQLVLSTVLLQGLGDLAGVLDLPQLDVALALLDRISDQLRRASLTLSTHNESLLLLAGFINKESGTLGVLLGNLLGFDGVGEFGGEGQMLWYNLC